MAKSKGEKVIRDRLNTLRSELSQYTTEKMSRRLSEQKVAEYELLIDELKSLLKKLEKLQ